jgi:hypothetical protein
MELVRSPFLTHDVADQLFHSGVVTYLVIHKSIYISTSRWGGLTESVMVARLFIKIVLQPVYGRALFGIHEPWLDNTAYAQEIACACFELQDPRGARQKLEYNQQQYIYFISEC